MMAKHATQSDIQPHVSEKKYRILFEESPVMHVHVSPHDARILDCNKLLVERLGFECKADFVGKPVFEVYHEACLADAQQAFDCFITTGQVRNAELILKHKDGNKIPVILNASAVRDDQGKILFSSSTWVDITDLREVQHKYSLQNKIFEQLLEGSMAGYWDWMVQENTEYLSPTFKKMFGYEDHEMENTPEAWQKIIHPDDLPKVFYAFNKHVHSKGKIPYDNTARYYHKNGSIVWVYCRGKVIEWDDQGNPVRMVGSHIDITSLKRAEEALKATQRKLLRTTDKLKIATSSAKIGIWERDIKTDTLVWDDTMYDLYGITKETFSSTRKSWQVCLHPDDAEHITQEVELAMNNEKELDTDFRIIWPDQSIHHIKVVATIERDVNGTPLRILGTNWDITKEKEATQKERRRLKQLEIKNKELEQFAYIASHDLQEPLRTITSFSSLLKQGYHGQLDENADIYLNFISEATARMSNLISGLLNYSRIGQRREKMIIDCNQLLIDVQKDLAVRISETDTTLVIEALPCVTGVKTELHILFQNLISNAIKFCKKDVAPHINISAQQKSTCWEFAVKDNGIGIADEHQERIFKIFQRLHTRSEYEGTGIGLANCQKIVTLHGGDIWLKSHAEVGSTFYFTIQN